MEKNPLTLINMNVIFIIFKIMKFIGLIHAKSIELWLGPYEFSRLIINCYA